MDCIRDCARILLALIRLVNGGIGLFAPHLIVRRFENDEHDPAVAHYAIRMFGIRTILIAIDLLRGPGPGRSHAIRVAPIVHASDTVAAALAAASGRVSTKTGATIVGISTLNTILALIMQGGGSHPESKAG